MNDIPEDEEFDLGPSKTQLKKASHAYQDLGEELTQLSDQQLARLPLSDELLSAVTQARTMRANAARKRQIQFIGKLIRNSNGDDIIAALDSLNAETNNSHQLLQHSEQWSHRLIQEPDALAEFLAQYYEADRQQLRSLIRNCQKLPAEEIHSPAHKKLRKWLRECFAQHNF
ncbi:ribosome biogenesis factor YjgA [Halioxenophilus aromaticivorans]|uniref:Dual-action ribosomal maturation protein DarP n=1 Tax=Halioxenophilus aromaticivorans TaxID=1306992 RepID=A0AAV3U6T8_9ALTE